MRIGDTVRTVNGDIGRIVDIDRIMYLVKLHRMNWWYYRSDLILVKNKPNLISYWK